MFETNPKPLKEILERIERGELQLPDFQRDWVWDDEGVRGLIASIAAGFPVGALLTLTTGGEVRFKPRPLANAPEGNDNPDELLLDGQQRMTSCFQALKSPHPVKTRNAKGRDLSVFYFIDMREALQTPVRLENAILSIPADLKVKSDFDRKIDLDLSSPEKQYAAHMFPLNQTFDSRRWFREYQKVHGDEGFEIYEAFDEQVLMRIQDYKVPIIRLTKENTREAVCTVFEKVNVGGKKLDAFELLTAMFAADQFDLRADMRGTETQGGRLQRIKGHDKNGVLRELSERDVLQVAIMLQTYDSRMSRIAAGETDPKRIPAVSLKAEALLDLRSEVYQAKADGIEQGFIKARKFLNRLNIRKAWDVPYLPSTKLLAGIYALWDGAEMNAAVIARLEQWFWCISLGETYGSSTDSRIARDLLEVLPWLKGEASLPRAITEITITTDRLDRLRTRNAAGYKALNAAIVQRGCLDFRTGKPAHIMAEEDDSIDIHHIFPRAWAEKNGIPPERYDTIVNKTPLFRQTNQKVGGRAPSIYLTRLEKELSSYNSSHDTFTSLDDVLKTHLVEPELLQNDDFEAFYIARREALAKLIEEKTGRQVTRSQDADAA